MKLGITKGDWTAVKNDIGEHPFYYYISANTGALGYMPLEQKHGDGLCRYTQQDAQLIADAGTTANKCGLLPSEILEQRDELLEAFKSMNIILKGFKRLDKSTIGYRAQEKAFIAINNAQNK